MTIKNQDKNISAEKKNVLTNVISNSSGMLTFTVEDFYDGTNTTIPIDLSKYKLHLKVLNDDYNSYSGLSKLEDLEKCTENGEFTYQNLNNHYSFYQEERFQSYSEVEEYRKANIFLVPFESELQEEGIFREYLWIQNKFEVIGSTKVSLNSKEDVDNKVSSWSDPLSDDKYPSEKLVKDSLNLKVNTSDIDSLLSNSSENPVQNKIIKNALDEKQPNLVSGTNIKTINNKSLLGEGNITISGDVGTFADLQELITNATAGDIIILDKDYKNDGSELQITINKNLTIIGDNHTIDADEKSKIFNITGGRSSAEVVVNINGLNFINGYSSDYGGAINTGDYTKINISDCNFNNNSASNDGGAILCNSSLITDCSFNNNHSGLIGGAITEYSSTIINCNFNNNSSESGGAIEAFSGNITNCNFDNNNASKGSGGAIRCYIGSEVITNCIFKNNTARTDGDNIYSYNSITIYNCNGTFSQNDGVTNKPYLTDHQTIKTINNESIIGSGNITISGNDTGSFTDLQELITNASSGDIIILDKDYKNSGSESEITINKNLTIIGGNHTIDADENSRIFNITGGTSSNNIVINIDGINFINGKETSGVGGAINVANYNKINISNCVFNNNKSSINGGAIYCDSSSNMIINCDFNNNTSSSNSGAVYANTSNNIIISCNFFNNSAYNAAGALGCSSSNTVTNCNFNNNRANYGGAIHTQGASTITDCMFKNNTAEDGNDIYSNSSITIYNCDTSTANLHNVTNKPYLIDHQTATATTSSNGLMSSTDKTKLDGMDTVEWTITYDDDSTRTITLIVQREEE